MTSQLGNKRRFIDGRDDWRFQTEKAPVTTSADQFIQGQKVFNDPVTFYKDVLCEGVYKGDGSYLTGIVPSAGGIMTGQLVVPSIRFNDNTIQTTAYKSLVPGTFSNSQVVVNSFGQIASITNGPGGGGGGPAYSIDVSPPTGLTGWFYPTFVTNSGMGQTLYCDNQVQQLQYDPVLGLLKTATFQGALNGNAVSADLASQVTITNAPTGSRWVVLSSTDSSTGPETSAMQAHTSLKFNASTNKLTANLDGLADQATNAGYATNAGNSDTADVASKLTLHTTSGNPSHHILFADATTGNQEVQANTNLTYNTTTNTLTSLAFAGPLTGNVTGDVSGSSGSCSGNAASSTQVNVTNSTSGTANRILFSTGTDGNQTVNNNANLTFNASTNTLTTANFDGTAKNVIIGSDNTNIYRKLTFEVPSGTNTLGVDTNDVALTGIAYNPSSETLRINNLNVTNSLTGIPFANFVDLTSDQSITGAKRFTILRTENSTSGVMVQQLVDVNDTQKSYFCRQGALNDGEFNPTTKINDILFKCGTSGTGNHAINHTVQSLIAVGLRMTSTAGTSATCTMTGGSNTVVLDSTIAAVRIRANGLFISNYVGNTGYDLYIGVANQTGFGQQQIVIGTQTTTLRGKSFTNSQAYNILIGEGAGDNLDGASSVDCIAIGRKALGQAGSNLGGYNNIAIGKNAGYNLDYSGGGTTASNNTLIGANAGSSITTGQLNTTLGGLAGGQISTGNANFCMGYQAGYRITSGAYNTFIGSQAGGSGVTTITGQHHIGIGFLSLSNISGGANGHVGIGYQAGEACNSANATMCIGYQAGKANTNQTFVIGNSSARNMTGTYNCVIGNGLAEALVAGSYNTFIGTLVGGGVVSNQNNTMVGYNVANTATGNNNTVLGASIQSSAALGNSVIIGNTLGSANLPQETLLIGYNTGTALTGLWNTVIGNRAGIALAAGTGNVIIGANAGSDVVGGSNNVIIAGGSSAIASGTTSESDTVRIGRPGTAKFCLQGSLLHRVINYTFNNTPVTLSATNMYTLIVFTISANTTLTIPVASASNYGTEIIFRKHLAAGNAFILTVEADTGRSDFISPAGTALTAMTIGTTAITARIVCTNDPATPANYFWSILQNA